MGLDCALFDQGRCVIVCCAAGREQRENAFRNRPFDSIPKSKLARLTNIIVIGKSKTWFIRLGAEAVRIPGDVAPPWPLHTAWKLGSRRSLDTARENSVSSFYVIQFVQC